MLKNKAPKLAAIHKEANTQIHAQSITCVNFSIRKVTHRMVTIPAPLAELLRLLGISYNNWKSQNKNSINH